jgi:hypothetical protein
MTTREFVGLEKQLVRELPGFAIKGRLMFASPVQQVLKGINFEPSAFSKKMFTVTVFVTPFCVPHRHLSLNFGKRLRHKESGARWDGDMLNLPSELAAVLKSQAVPFLSRANSLRDFVELAKSFSFENPHTLEAIAYVLARVGDFQQAASVLDQLLEQLDVKVPWQEEMANRAVALRAKVSSNPTEAKHQLETWEAETRQNLGLENS